MARPACALPGLPGFTGVPGSVETKVEHSLMPSAS